MMYKLKTYCVIVFFIASTKKIFSCPVLQPVPYYHLLPYTLAAIYLIYIFFNVPLKLIAIAYIFFALATHQKYFKEGTFLSLDIS